MNEEVTLQPLPLRFLRSPEKSEKKEMCSTEMEESAALSLLSLPEFSIEKDVKKRTRQAKELDQDFLWMETPEDCHPEKKRKKEIQHEKEEKEKLKKEGKNEKDDRKKLPTNTPVWKKMKRLSQSRMNDWWNSPNRR